MTLKDVGHIGPNHYGAYDMGAEVAEWVFTGSADRQSGGGRELWNEYINPCLMRGRAGSVTLLDHTLYHSNDIGPNVGFRYMAPMLVHAEPWHDYYPPEEPPSLPADMVPIGDEQVNVITNRPSNAQIIAAIEHPGFFLGDWDYDYMNGKFSSASKANIPDLINHNFYSVNSNYIPSHLTYTKPQAGYPISRNAASGIRQESDFVVPARFPYTDDHGGDYFRRFGERRKPLTPFVGSVPYKFYMKTNLVTVDEYCEFLNSVATSGDVSTFPTPRYQNPQNWSGTYYNVQMESSISREWNGSIFQYSPVSNMSNKPITNVSFAQAVRYCEWLSSGKISSFGFMSSKMDITGRLTNNPDGKSYHRLTRAGGEIRGGTKKYRLPSFNEWYKAAYYKGGGLSSEYWSYGNSSNSRNGFNTQHPFEDLIVSRPLYNLTLAMNDHSTVDAFEKSELIAGTSTYTDKVINFIENLESRTAAVPGRPDLPSVEYRIDGLKFNNFGSLPIENETVWKNIDEIAEVLFKSSKTKYINPQYVFGDGYTERSMVNGLRDSRHRIFFRWDKKYTTGVSKVWSIINTIFSVHRLYFNSGGIIGADEGIKIIIGKGTTVRLSSEEIERVKSIQSLFKKLTVMFEYKVNQNALDERLHGQLYGTSFRGLEILAFPPAPGFVNQGEGTSASVEDMSNVFRNAVIAEMNNWKDENITDETIQNWKQTIKNGRPVMIVNASIDKKKALRLDYIKDGFPGDPYPNEDQMFPDLYPSFTVETIETTERISENITIPGVNYLLNINFKNPTNSIFGPYKIKYGWGLEEDRGSYVGDYETTALSDPYGGGPYWTDANIPEGYVIEYIDKEIYETQTDSYDPPGVYQASAPPYGQMPTEPLSNPSTFALSQGAAASQATAAVGTAAAITPRPNGVGEPPFDGEPIRYTLIHPHYPPETGLVTGLADVTQAEGGWGASGVPLKHKNEYLRSQITPPFERAVPLSNTHDIREKDPNLREEYYDGTILKGHLGSSQSPDDVDIVTSLIITRFRANIKGDEIEGDKSTPESYPSGYTNREVNGLVPGKSYYFRIALIPRSTENPEGILGGGSQIGDLGSSRWHYIPEPIYIEELS